MKDHTHFQDKLSNTKPIRYANLSSKVNIFIIGFKLKDFFSINKQITIITIVMQTQAKYSPCFNEVNTNFFSGEPKLPLIH